MSSLIPPAVAAPSMSLIPGRSRPTLEDEKRIASFLLRRCGLSEDDLRRVAQLMQQQELSFSEAVLRLGLASQADVDAAATASPAMAEPPRAKLPAELSLVADPYGAQAEGLRALRTELLLRRKAGEGNVFAVVSPQAGEGRSRMAAELALGFAQLQQPTLLVDADLRKPRQHKLFGVDAASKGLAEAIAEREAPAIQAVAGQSHLFVLTAGALSRNPLELVSASGLAELIEGWKRRYQHVIFDTPEATGYSDALAVTTATRRVLLLSRQHKSSMSAMRELMHRLAATQAEVLGAALSRF